MATNKNIIPKHLPVDKRNKYVEKITIIINKKLRNKLPSKFKSININKYVSQLEDSVYKFFYLLGSATSYYNQLITLHFNLNNNAYYLIKNFTPEKLSRLTTYELGDQGDQSDQSDRDEDENENEKNEKINYYDPVIKFEKSEKLKPDDNKKNEDASQHIQIVKNITRDSIDPLLVTIDENGKLIKPKSLEKCRRCNGKYEVNTIRKQTRSSDEGETVFCYCECGHNWKISN